ncbi:DotD/TraH family lipoprotein [Roseomonas hellenica]|uniref:DotD/TraH family lipoprotein n=1 Tax=Plastoroseomonas hellenica TaxID=2687306 RepID=A0ABS5EWI1_9PROT|nr:DotD/TraH family lipoprotein [Plastoroseomonas hellenica]MBR0664652.1 DotD/TraH family lipoprotein [Plastoroseomonas hellenica]
MSGISLRAAPALLCITVLAGCAGTGPTTGVVTPGMANPEIALRRSLEQVGEQMAQLGNLNAASIARQGGPVVPEELRRPVAFVWSGSLSAGVRRLAEAVGYRVVESGVENAQPVNVAIDLRETTVVDAFAALGEQAGAYATVQLDPASRTVQVIRHV